MDDAKNPVANSEKAEVVVVEDDQFISRMYEMKLAKAGYKIVMGVNGQDAVKLITEHQPKLAMVDINMPEMSGLDAIAQLKSNGYDFSRTQVVFLTNSNNPNDIEKAKALDADYLIKADQTPRNVLELIQKKLGK
jgi:two-component system chemotaxis sensor kinase CheA